MTTTDCLLVPIKHDLAWLKRYSEAYDVVLTDTTEEYAVLGLMGPESARIATEVSAEILNNIKYFKIGEAQIAGHHVRAVRMSYVGEAGWEITCKTEHATDIYKALNAAGARPAGMYAQSSMRVEKGFAAMGHELDGDITPVDEFKNKIVYWIRCFG